MGLYPPQVAANALSAGLQGLWAAGTTGWARTSLLAASGIRSGVSRRPEVLPLQVPKGASELAVADFGTTGEVCLQRCQKCRPRPPAADGWHG